MTKRILLVEDEPSLLDLVKLNLELDGNKVVGVRDGIEAIKRFKDEQFDLVILDIMIPGIDGLNVCENIRLKNSEVPILFLSAKNSAEDRIAGLKKGADDYLTKPFQEIELLNAIESRFKKIEILSKAIKNTQKGIEEFYQQATKHVELKSLSTDRKVSFVKKKQLIYSEGDYPIRFYFLKSGKVKTFNSNTDGKDFVTGLYNSGDFFGHIAIIENNDYQESEIGRAHV